MSLICSRLLLRTCPTRVTGRIPLCRSPFTGAIKPSVQRRNYGILDKFLGENDEDTKGEKKSEEQKTDSFRRDDDKCLSPFKVVFIGAGGINFGSVSGPWGESTQSERFERVLGPRMKVPAIIDPNPTLLRTTVENKQDPENRFHRAYKDTAEFRSIDEYLASKPEKPHVIVFGLPPYQRQKLVRDGDPEIKIADAFPGIGLMIEKPVAAVEDHEMLKKIGSKFQEKNLIVSVGYILRYLRAVQRIKEAIAQMPNPVMATHARLSSSYVTETRPWTWRKSAGGGPMIEEGTQICDLSRYLSNRQVNLNDIDARAVEWWEEAGKLALIPVDENLIPEDERIPRVTGALWKYTSGAVGTLLHTINLQTPSPYPDTDVEVHADGYLFKILDLYHAPTLLTRAGDHDPLVLQYQNDDPYLREVAAVVDAVEGRGKGKEEILCDWNDAVETYLLSWAIRNASEE
ncbi:hypothetical protein SpCBS45565_g08055 [Spizellomyces sp. 'palustris']|nr:hypothetical protein SpCBS45565_g08055 [Spizellomyces sp. 'palustris']